MLIYDIGKWAWKLKICNFGDRYDLFVIFDEWTKFYLDFNTKAETQIFHGI